MDLPWDLLHDFYFYFLCFVFFPSRLTCSLLNDRMAGPLHNTINSKSQEVS
jgi:hypothetical protein